MTLDEMQQLWEIQHPNEPFWDVVRIPKELNKDDLVNYLLFEFGDMQALDSDSGFFRERIRNFFRIHEWNIQKLVDTTQFDYDPLTDKKWEQTRTVDDDKTVDTTSDRDINTNITNHETEVMDDDTTGSHNLDQTQIHYLSAFNDAVITDDGVDLISDTEKDRDTNRVRESTTGTDDRTTDTDFTSNQRTDDDIVGKEESERDIFEKKNFIGNNTKTFQELIEQERKQAQFNIYKWIGRHFTAELLIAVW